jgi:hypothetical protein
MKKIFLFILLLTATFATAQPPATRNPKPATTALATVVSDSVAIRATVLNYIEGYYTGDAKRMTKALHPELAKRIIVQDSTGTAMVKNMGATELIYITGKRAKQKDTTGIPLKTDIVIYDIYKNVATVKVTTNKFGFIDYLHLAKVNGEWKIVNVLWEFNG